MPRIASVLGVVRVPVLTGGEGAGNEGGWVLGKVAIN